MPPGVIQGTVAWLTQASGPGCQELSEREQRQGLVRVVQEAGLVQAAEVVWQVFAAGPSTAAAAERMLQNVRSSSLGPGSGLGHTAWNAYSFNINYRTGMLHVCTLVSVLNPVVVRERL